MLQYMLHIKDMLKQKLPMVKYLQAPWRWPTVRAETYQGINL